MTIAPATYARLSDLGRGDRLLPRVRDTFADEPLYARVGCGDLDGERCLMELELMEPSLFLRTNPDAVRRFALEIAARS
jgi:hypothetical protein